LEGLKDRVLKHGFLKHRIIQGRLNIWTEDLKAFFLSWKLTEIWKNDTNIIWTSLKNTHFSKVSRLLLKNCACHALLNFEIQMGVADPIFEPQPCNFEKLCIFCRSSNDISIIF